MLFEENKITHIFRKKPIVSIQLCSIFLYIFLDIRKYLNKIEGKYEEMTLTFEKKLKSVFYIYVIDYRTNDMDDHSYESNTLYVSSIVDYHFTV